MLHSTCDKIIESVPANNSHSMHAAELAAKYFEHTSSVYRTFLS